jgi:murein DD-endopeptidase MepM/ murein hydrolase activator NlpD
VSAKIPRWPVYLLGAVLAVALASGTSSAYGEGGSVSFGLPVLCRLGQDCFVQQTPDLDPGPGVLDSFCGHASYDGHDGWDIRLRSLADIGSEVKVVAVADGKVLRVRDGIVDRLFKDKEKQAFPAGQECGNGLVIDHGDGLSTQYCHLKQGSLLVLPGEKVRRGDPLGSIGASGLAAFPHVHLTTRRSGAAVDPLSGNALGQTMSTCDTTKNGLFNQEALQQLRQSPLAILGFGLSGTAPDLAKLMIGTEPDRPRSGNGALIAWLWTINLESGDQFAIRVNGPDGAALIDDVAAALPSPKAQYLSFAGRKRPPGSGRYEVTVKVLRQSVPIASRSMTVDIEGR